MKLIRTILKASLSVGLTVLVVYLPSLYIETRLNLITVSILAYIIIWLLSYFIIDKGEKKYDIEESFPFIWDFFWKEIDQFSSLMFLLLFIGINILYFFF